VTPRAGIHQTQDFMMLMIQSALSNEPGAAQVHVSSRRHSEG
jgi:hypothetical protein